jgi:hypothetical protein
MRPATALALLTYTAIVTCEVLNDNQLNGDVAAGDQDVLGDVGKEFPWGGKSDDPADGDSSWDEEDGDGDGDGNNELPDDSDFSWEDEDDDIEPPADPDNPDSNILPDPNRNKDSYICPADNGTRYTRYIFSPQAPVASPLPNTQELIAGEISNGVTYGLHCGQGTLARHLRTEFCKTLKGCADLCARENKC